MLSKKWLKFIKSLQTKKFRQENGAFLVEGAKSVRELLQSDFAIRILFATEEFYHAAIRSPDGPGFAVEIVNPAELAAAGVFQSNNACLAVAGIKENRKLFAEAGEYVLVLDEVKDPGNLGTLIRVADWYGIRKVVCSANTADCYNPKVIAASVGSFTRVDLYYCDLRDYLSQHRDRAIYGAFLDGENLHQTSFAASGYVVMGNESRGISETLRPLIPHRITIPRFGGAESLNVGIAAAVVCDNLRKQLTMISGQWAVDG
ncbi:MAG: RNA methyltransferase [Ferruginibacter sp.]|nr:RNA methyltransferase [Cytophagales bacterium]